MGWMRVWARETVVSMPLPHRSKFDAVHEPRCSLFRRSPSASRSLRRLSWPTMVAICPWLRFVFIEPGGAREPSPGSENSLPPGTVGFAAPADGDGVVPGAPPGREGLKLH